MACALGIRQNGLREPFCLMPSKSAYGRTAIRLGGALAWGEYDGNEFTRIANATSKPHHLIHRIFEVTLARVFKSRLRCSIVAAVKEDVSATSQKITARSYKEENEAGWRISAERTGAAAARFGIISLQRERGLEVEKKRHRCYGSKGTGWHCDDYRDAQGASAVRICRTTGFWNRSISTVHGLANRRLHAETVSFMRHTISNEVPIEAGENELTWRRETGVLQSAQGKKARKP
ncbi:hypothetical protein C8R45DRAFT_1128027 [Mycena sanguinolenta]|nr:hypothetical protein C8R45DRAFT_1128027 [Mycena sanguinolenta]